MISSELKKKLIFATWKFLPRDIVNLVIDESKSFLGRLFSKPLVVTSNEQIFFNFGCGESPVSGFINVDFYSALGNKYLDYQVDFRYPLKIADEVADGIFTEHMIEHLSYNEAEGFFKECHRILKKNGVLRVICPDVSKFIQAYVSPEIHQEFLKSEAPLTTTPMEALSDITQGWDHKSAWDFDTMSLYMKRAGFSETINCSFAQGRLEVLLVDKKERERQSLYVEAVKSDS